MINKILAEYIWIDGTKPTAQLRSKTKVLSNCNMLYENLKHPPIWGFDGSSTNQAAGHNSDCVLKPIKTVRDPLRGGNNILVLCEVLDTNMVPHETNTRDICIKTNDLYKKENFWFGLEQEYTLFKNGKPLGFPKNGFPNPQGQYYCSVGAANAFGREIAEEHLSACLKIGLNISGINAEVCPGQWEFQIGPADAITVSDDIWIARYLLYRIAEEYGVTVSLNPKPVEGDWNGAGCHANFSTKKMRDSFDACLDAAKALGNNPTKDIKNYGHGIEKRLTGKHETCIYTQYCWGISDRQASVRIPWQVAKDEKGYIEDRRPNSNCDPYLVTKTIMSAICGHSIKVIK